MLRLPAKHLWVGEGTPGGYQQDDQTRVTEKKNGERCIEARQEEKKGGGSTSSRDEQKYEK